MTVVRVTSHRSRQRLARTLPHLGREHYKWVKGSKYIGPNTGYYIIPDSDLLAAVQIPGVTPAPRTSPSDLRPCWSTR